MEPISGIFATAPARSPARPKSTEPCFSPCVGVRLRPRTLRMNTNGKSHRHDIQPGRPEPANGAADGGIRKKAEIGGGGDEPNWRRLIRYAATRLIFSKKRIKVERYSSVYRAADPAEIMQRYRAAPSLPAAILLQSLEQQTPVNCLNTIGAHRRRAEYPVDSIVSKSIRPRWQLPHGARRGVRAGVLRLSTLPTAGCRSPYNFQLAQ